jgi:hypothetical protein
MSAELLITIALLAIPAVFLYALFTSEKEVMLTHRKRENLENLFEWCLEEFGEERFSQIEMHPASKRLFPMKKETDLENIQDIANEIAKRMDIDPESIELHISERENVPYRNAAGLYMHKNELGKYQVWVDYALYKEDVVNLITVLSHEFSHIKLLGEERTKVNNEKLTDLCVVFWGFGLFISDSVYYEKTVQTSLYSTTRYTKKMGYLSQWEVAYSLGLFAFHKNDFEPVWLKDLSKEMRSYVKVCIKHIIKLSK